MHVLSRIGWCLLALVGTIAVFLGLSFAALQVTSDPIVATIGINGVFITVGVGFRLWLRRTHRSGDIRRRKVDDLTWLYVIGGVVLVFIAGQVWAATAYDLFGSTSFDRLRHQRAQAPAQLLVVLTLVLAPIGEELFLRGTVQELLRPKVPVLAATLTVTLAFALVHGNIVQGLAVVSMGVLLSMLYERTRSPWPGVLVHGGYNLAAGLVPKPWIALMSHPLPALVLILVTAVVLLALWSRFDTETRQTPEQVEDGMRD